MRTPAFLISGIAALGVGLIAMPASAQSLNAFVDASGLSIDAGFAGGARMKVTIVGPDGSRLVEEIVPASSYRWSSFYQDGEYRYDAYVLIGDASADADGGSARPPVRVHGSFVVAGGALQISPADGADAG